MKLKNTFLAVMLFVVLMPSVYSQPFNNDAGISGIVPLSQYAGNVSLNVYLKNFGTDTLILATVDFILDGTPGSSFSWSGSLLQDSIDGPLNLGTFYAGGGSHVLKVYSSNPNDSVDGDNSNDTLTVNFSLTVAATLPYCESFENTLGQWQQSTTDNYNWTNLNIATPSFSTGPDAAYDGSYYIYTEANNITTGWSANLEIPVDFTNADNPEISFYYHMYGSAMGALHLDVFDTIWHNDVWTLAGNQGNTWTNHFTNLSAYGNFGVVILRFRGVRGTGNGSDMALDKVCVYEVFANNVAVNSIIQPSPATCGDSLANIVMIVKNNGNQSQTDIPVGIYVTRPDSTVLTLIDTLAGTLSAGATDTITIDSINMYPPGIYTIKGYTALTGEAYPADDTLSVNVQVNADITSFPFISNFESSNTYFTLTGSALASATIATETGGNHALYFTGGTLTTGWIGGQTTTTAINAWNDDTTHHAMGYTCVVDATSMTDIKLKFDLKQVSPTNYFLYNWVRVLVNDTVQLTDINGVTNYNPPQATYSTKMFDLSAYAGTNFRLTFQGSMRYNSSYSIYTYPGGDNAYIDNIMIYQPSENDAGISAIDSLSPYSGNLNLNVYLKNFGTDTLTSATINYKLDGIAGTTPYSWTDSLLQDSVDGPLNLGTVFAAAGNHVLKIYSSSPNGSSDGDNSNDTLTVTFTLIAPAIVPYCESFETSLGQWQQATDDNYDWTRLTGATQTTSTGPDLAYDGNYYVYTEASAPAVTGSVFSIELPVDLTSVSNPEVSFYYHMYGVGMGSLHLDVYDSLWHTDVWTLSGDLGNVWVNQVTDLSAFANSGIVKLRFRSIRGSATTGDMALDQVCVYDVLQNDIMVTSILQPGTSTCSDSAANVEMIIKNNGIAAQTDIPVSVEIITPAANTLTLSDTLFGTLDPGVSDTITIGTFDMSLAGIYTVTGFADLANDQYTNNDSISFNTQVNSLITTFPFTEDFESGNNYFNLMGSSLASASITTDAGNHTLYFTGGNVNQLWTGQQTTTTAENAWVDNIAHHAWAYTCNIDATSLTGLNLSFDLKQVSAANYYLYNWFRVLINDSIQISDITGASNFNNDGTNVYYNKIFNLNSYAGTQFKITFQAAVKYNSTYASYPVGDNVYVDNINLFIPPPVDLVMSTLNNFPISGCSLNTNQGISVSILNNGSATMTAGTQIPVAYSINGGTAVNENITLTNDFLSNQTIDYTFTQTADFSNDGTYSVSVWTSMTGDADLSNDTVNGSVTNVISMGSYPYSQDFETNSTGWSSEMISGSDSWQFGTPAQTYINAAHSGTNAWMTGLTQNYPLSEHSVLYSPCFDFSNLFNPSLSFWLNLHTESNYDGAVLEATIDNGTTWTKVGSSQAGFYNSNINQNPNPPLITVPWWSGNNNGWNNYVINLSTYAGQEGVRFRFRFASDYAIADEGLAIDDFSLYDIMMCDAGADQQICPGNSAQLDVSVLAGSSPYTYLWQPGAGLSDSTIANPIAVTDTSVTYYVTVTDAFGSVAGDSVFIEIVQSIQIDLGNDFDICQGESVPLGAPAGAAYLWSNGETTQTIMITLAGNYSVTVDQGNGCTGISNVVSVGVNPVPVVYLGDDIQVPAVQTVTLDAANPGAIFLWSTGETTQTINVTITGTYTVTVTAAGCSSSDQIVVTFILGIGEVLTDLSVNVNPNPSNGIFILEISHASGDISADIYNVAGDLVYRKIITSTQHATEFDISGLPKGFYYLRLTDSRKVISRKILSQ